MDIEKVQKINDLARELLKHGMASDMEDATKKAEEMVMGKAEVSEFRKNVGEEDTKKDGISMQVPNMEIRKLNVKIDDLSKALSEMHSRTGNVVRRLGEIEAEIDRLKKRSEPVMLEKERGSPQTMLHKEERKPENHPKIGNFNSGDVAIDKIFYSGPPRDD